jgi:hypothetical protein
MGGRLAISRARALASLRVSPFLGEAIDEAGSIALLGGDLRAENQVLEGQPPADQARESLRPPEAWDNAQVRLGLPHPGRLLQDADMAGHRDLAAAAESMAH